MPSPRALAFDDATDTARPLLAVGWLAKGLLFVLIGVLAVVVAQRGPVAADTDQTGALRSLAGLAAGRLIVLAVGAGLAAYAMWQLWAAAIADTDGPLDLARRVGWIGLAVTYGLLAETAITMAVHGGTSSDGGDDGATSPSGISDRLLDWPAGEWLVAAIGLGTIAVGLYNLARGVGGDFLDDIETDDLGRGTAAALRLLGSVGFVARAVLLGLAGWLLLDAARTGDAWRAAGIDDSLDALSRATGGSILLTATGIGIAAAGVYDMVTFHRQRIDD